MTAIKSESDQSVASLNDGPSASTRVPYQLTALEICSGLVFCFVLFPGECARICVHARLKI